MKIAKGTLKSHQVGVIRDSKYVTKGMKCYNSGSLQASSEWQRAKITTKQLTRPLFLKVEKIERELLSLFEYKNVYSEEYIV